MTMILRSWSGNKLHKKEKRLCEHRRTPSTQGQIITGCQNNFSIDSSFLQLRTKNQGISHKAVDEAWSALAEVSNSMNSSLIYQIAGAAGNLKPGINIILCLIGRQPLIVVMNDNALFERFMNRFFKDRNKIGLANENKSKTIQAVEMDIHKHLNISKDPGV